MSSASDSTVVGYLIQCHFMTSVKLEMRLPLLYRIPRHRIPRLIPELSES